MRRRLLFLIAATTLCSVAPRARADDAEVLAKLRACAAEQDDRRRLSCYDNQLRPPSRKPPPQAASPPAAEDLATQEQQFGMGEQLARQAAQAPHLNELTSRVVAVADHGRGASVVTLENGQLWEVLEGEGPVDLDAGTVVSIRAGVLGAYYLSVKKVSVRVKRLK
jgi:hypothetical protein